MSVVAETIAHPKELSLSAERQAEIRHAVTQLLRETVYERPVTVLPGVVADLTVSGAFVSLKRQKQLRGCCGGLHPEPNRLGKLIPDAVMRTVFDDPRFPPVSSTELPYLDCEIWLLFNPRRVTASGADRAREVVTGGKHGVVIRWSDQRGLLLPGVAAEHNWDPPTFLDHVCLKAGLHPSRWQEDDATLLTFEGLAICGPVDGETSEGLRFLSERQVAAYLDLCRRNLVTLLLGGTPRYSAPELPDGTICGLVISLDLGGGRPLQASKIDVRRGMALQASLYQLTHAFATALAQAGADDTRLEHLALSILYDPMLHGGLDHPDLRGVQSERRALLVMDRGRSSLVYGRDQEPEALLGEATRALAVEDSRSATIFSLAADVSAPHLVHVAGPHATSGPAVRPAAMAGKFYPAEPAALHALVHELLGPEQRTASWSAAMVPHAGLRYSGRVAGSVFRRLTFPSTVIVISPKHTGFGMEWAIAPHHYWSIPGARLAADVELAQQLAESVPGLVLDAAAHQQEHGIEVELPFLARLAPQIKVVGVALGGATLDQCQKMGQGLAGVVAKLPEPPLLLISSDMNHFASDAATRQLDEMALECLDRLDTQALYETCRTKHVTMCGMIPAVVALEALRHLGKPQRAERVAYATTADTTGDPSRVVGYAGMVFA